VFTPLLWYTRRTLRGSPPQVWQSCLTVTGDDHGVQHLVAEITCNPVGRLKMSAFAVCCDNSATQGCSRDDGTKPQFFFDASARNTHSALTEASSYHYSVPLHRTKTRASATNANEA